jgi:hypothetical protein
MDYKHEYELLRGFVESVAAGDMSRTSMIAQAEDILNTDDDEELIDHDLETKDRMMEARW